ncbi:modular serine protease [Carabus blaptoides fortunei]
MIHFQYKFIISIILFGSTCIVAKCTDGEIRSIRSTSQSNVTCSPIISDSVDADCELNGVKVDCSKPAVDGTMARAKCKAYYVAGNVQNHVRICRDGSWDYPLMKCVPECGQLPFKAQPLSLIGKPEEDTSVVPWHVGVYKGNKTNQYTEICGGSIISPNIIVSVAHCFTSLDGTLSDAKQYIVAGGKHYRNYYNTQDISAQKIQVKEIVIPPQFRGQLTNYISDIAFVVLEKPFTITRTVQPVCVDWSNQYESSQLIENNAGKIASWGIPNESIQQLNIPFIELAQCINELPTSLVRYITADKFCAGYTSGMGVCLGDSGNGLAFKRKDTNQYYLRGVASIGSVIDASCKSESYQIYTKISNYLSLLQTIVNRE